MSMPVQDTTVRSEIVVEAPVERAFSVFVEQFDRIKPREHNLLAVDIAETVLEPRAGGRDLRPRGRRQRVPPGRGCWPIEPPRRIMFSWDIGPTWQVETDPARASEVEVRFIAETPGADPRRARAPPSRAPRPGMGGHARRRRRRPTAGRSTCSATRTCSPPERARGARAGSSAREQLSGSGRGSRPRRISAIRSGAPPRGARRRAASSTGQPAQRGVARQQRAFTPPPPPPVGSTATRKRSQRSARNGVGTVRGGSDRPDRPGVAAARQYVCRSAQYAAETTRSWSAYFYSQAEEEREHAMKMVNYLIDRGVPARHRRSRRAGVASATTSSRSGSRSSRSARSRSRSASCSRSRARPATTRASSSCVVPRRAGRGGGGDGRSAGSRRAARSRSRCCSRSTSRATEPGARPE